MKQYILFTILLLTLPSCALFHKSEPPKASWAQPIKTIPQKGAPQSPGSVKLSLLPVAKNDKKSTVEGNFGHDFLTRFLYTAPGSLLAYAPQPQQTSNKLTQAPRQLSWQPEARRSYSLADCIRLAMRENANLKAHEIAVAQKDQEIYASWGGFLPTLGVRYNTLDFQSDALKEKRGSYRSYDTNSLLLTLSQPIFDGFSNIVGLKKAILQKHRTEQELRLAKMQLVAEVRTAYYNKLYAESLRRNFEQSISRLLSQLNIAAAWVEQRLAPPLRELEVKTRLAHARQQLIHAQAQEDIALSRLRNTMMLPPDIALPLADDLENAITAPCTSLADCRSIARRIHPDLELSTIAIDIAKQNASQTISRNLPHVNLDATWADGERTYADITDPEDEKKGQDKVDPNLLNQDEDYYSLMLSLTFYPFQGGRNIFSWRAQHKQITALRQQLQQRYHDLDSKIETRWLLWQESRAALKPAEEAVKEAKLAYAMNKKFVKLGVVSLDELLDAEIELTGAKSNLASAWNSLRQAEINLAFAVAQEWKEQ